MKPIEEIKQKQKEVKHQIVSNEAERFTTNEKMQAEQLFDQLTGGKFY